MKVMFVVASLAIVAALCMFCAVQPGKVAAYIRSDCLRSSKGLRNSTFAKLIMMEWFPIYLRGIAIMGCLAVLLALIEFFGIGSK
jgi:hypothetical protein